MYLGIVYSVEKSFETLVESRLNIAATYEHMFFHYTLDGNRRLWFARVPRDLITEYSGKLLVHYSTAIATQNV